MSLGHSSPGSRGTIWLAWASAIALSACAPRQVVLDRFAVDSPGRDELMGRMSCWLPSHVLVDHRKHETMGWAGGRELLYPEVMPWLGAAISAAAEQDTKAAPITIALNIAHMESHVYGNSFQLVLRVRDADDEASRWRTYRGSIADITWFGHDGELGSYVEQAAKLAIRDLVTSEGRCTRTTR